MWSGALRPDDGTYAALVRAFVHWGELGRAARVVHRIVRQAMPMRRRTVQPLLEQLCAENQARAAVRVWHRSEAHGAVFAAADFAALLGACCRAGELGQIIPLLRCLRDECDDRLPEPVVAAVHAALADARLPDGSAAFKLARVRLAATEHERCDHCGTALAQRRLSAEQRATVRDRLVARAAAIDRSGALSASLSGFADFLKAAPTDYDCVIDGPNVVRAAREGALAHARARARHLTRPSPTRLAIPPLARSGIRRSKLCRRPFQLLPGGGHAAAGAGRGHARRARDARQVHALQVPTSSGALPRARARCARAWLRARLAARAHTLGAAGVAHSRPRVVAQIPNHTRRQRNAMTELSVEELLIIEHWRQLGVVYEAEVSGKDDWVWMYASLLGEGRLVVTNDEMRDHWLHLLEHRLFRRWKESQLVHFAFVRQTDPTQWQIELQPPQPWAHATQCAPNGVWHIASADDERWLCATPLALFAEDPPCRGALLRRHDPDADSLGAMEPRPEPRAAAAELATDTADVRG
jgi:hypothetical protein